MGLNQKLAAMDRDDQLRELDAEVGPLPGNQKESVPSVIGQMMRLVIPGSMLTALGFQTILASFCMSVLGMRRK
jgi:hypothetical protein